MIYRPKNKILVFLVQTSELCLVAFDWIFFSLSRFFPRRQKNSILIVRLDAIGDFVIWLAAAKKIREVYSNYHITLLGNDVWTDLAKELPWFDVVVPLNRKRFLMNPLYRYSMLAKIAQGGYKTALHTVFHRDFLVGDVSVRASGAPTRIGFFGSVENSVPWQKKISDTWYTMCIHSSLKHQLEQDADFIRALGADYKASLPTLPRRQLRQDFISNNYYVIIPGAGHEMRQWPLDNFREIVTRIYRKTGMHGVLCGGKREANLNRAFLSGLDIPIRNLIGRTSLPDLVSIIANAKFLIGNDTGAIHIAVATSTPSLCILGGAHPGRYVPYPSDLNARITIVTHPMDCFNCDWHCIYNTPGTVPCISKISVDEVWEALSASVLKT